MSSGPCTLQSCYMKGTNKKGPRDSVAVVKVSHSRGCQVVLVGSTKVDEYIVEASGS